MVGYALELNDADIIAWDVARERLREPGYAGYDGKGWTFGAAAAASARLRPRDTSAVHFAQIDAAAAGPLPVPAAEVAYQQMRRWADTLGPVPGVWLASSAATPAQLGLLLGVSQAAGLDVAALADRAVAAVSALPFEGTVYCVDVELERAFVTEVLVHSGRAQRHGALLVPEMGLRTLYDAWSKAFAARMVSETRFDPLHTAGSEQALFDSLPQWLDTLRREDRIEEAGIEAGGVRYAIEFRAAHAANDVAPNYRALALALHAARRAREPAALLLTATAARLPGLIAALDDFQDCDVFTAKSGQAAQAALGVVELSARGGAAAALLLALPHNPYHSWLPARPATAAAGAAADADVQTATHVVFGGRAISLTAEPVIVGTAPTGARTLPIPASVAGVSRVHCSLSMVAGRAFVQDHSRFGCQLNDEFVDNRAIVKVGDRLRLGNPGVELTFVRME